MKFFDSQTIFFDLLGYGVSYLEFMGFVSGGVAVWLSARGNILSWPVGIVNVVLSFFLYFQTQLYPDMFLQVFFLITNIIGWWRWANPGMEEEDKKKELKVSRMNSGQWTAMIVLVFLGTAVLGSMASHLHEWLPSVFSLPSAFPFVDSFVTVTSIIATYLMVQKKVECWAVWIAIDVVATGMYFAKDLQFYSLLYFVFCIMAAYGFWNWLKEFRSSPTAVL